MGGDGGVRAGDLAGVQAGAQGRELHRARDHVQGQAGDLVTTEHIPVCRYVDVDNMDILARYHQPEPETATQMTNTFTCEVKKTTHCEAETRQDCKVVKYQECKEVDKRYA